MLYSALLREPPTCEGFQASLALQKSLDLNEFLATVKKLLAFQEA
jgi:hypothetical protein